MANQKVTLRDPLTGDQLYPATLTDQIFNEDGTKFKDSVDKSISDLAALVAQELAKVDSSKIGDVLTTLRPGSELGPNYLLADGRAINATDYPELFNMLNTTLVWTDDVSVPVSYFETGIETVNRFQYLNGYYIFMGYYLKSTANYQFCYSYNTKLEKTGWTKVDVDGLSSPQGGNVFDFVHVGDYWVASHMNSGSVFKYSKSINGPYSEKSTNLYGLGAAIKDIVYVNGLYLFPGSYYVGSGSYCPGLCSGTTLEGLSNAYRNESFAYGIDTIGYNPTTNKYYVVWKRVSGSESTGSYLVSWGDNPNAAVSAMTGSNRVYESPYTNQGKLPLDIAFVGNDIVLIHSDNSSVVYFKTFDFNTNKFVDVSNTVSSGMKNKDYYYTFKKRDGKYWLYTTSRYGTVPHLYFGDNLTELLTGVNDEGIATVNSSIIPANQAYSAFGNVFRQDGIYHVFYNSYLWRSPVYMGSQRPIPKIVADGSYHYIKAL